MDADAHGAQKSPMLFDSLSVLCFFSGLLFFFLYSFGLAFCTDLLVLILFFYPKKIFLKSYKCRN